MEACQSVRIWPSYSLDGGKTLIGTKDVLFPLNVEACRIKNRLMLSTTYSFSYIPPLKETGWHTDERRGCTLNIPIDENPHHISFKNKGEIIKYSYIQPTLVNGKIPHNGSNPTDWDRYNLLFHFDLDFHAVKNLYQEGNFISSWQQIYNMYHQVDGKIFTYIFGPSAKNPEKADIIVTEDSSLANRFPGKTIFITESEKNFDCLSTVIIDGKYSEVDLCHLIKLLVETRTPIKRIRFGGSTA